MKKTSCLFCKIANGSEDQSFRMLCSDSQFVAVLDQYPQSRGHFLVIPKKHVAEVSSMDKVGEFFELAINLAEKYVPKLGTEAYTLKVNNNLYKLDKNPLHVGHVHIHVIPKYKNKEENSKPTRANTRELADILQVLKS